MASTKKIPEKSLSDVTPKHVGAI